LLVGAKHLEDKLSVIAKNSSPNASPVQLSVVSCQLSVVIGNFLSSFFFLPPELLIAKRGVSHTPDSEAWR
jgi:hypothetical protein